MKRGFMIAVAAISMAGAAGANLFTTPSQGATAQPAPEKPSAVPALLAGAPSSPDPVAHVVVPQAARSVPTPPVRKASLEVRQQPVPLHLKPRVPVALPNIDTSEAYAKGEAGGPAGKASAAVTSTGDKTAAGDKSSEAAARAAIEADGYKGVQVLRKGVNGVWHAKALRGKTEVQVVVDSRGFVSAAD